MRVIIFLLILTVPLAYARVPLDKVNEKKVEILYQLAQEGIVDAYFYYYEETINNQKDKKYSQKKLNPVLFLSGLASGGHYGSLLKLGHNVYQLATSDQEIIEATTLISLSFLLGSEKAGIDLKLLPKMSSVTEKQVITGFNQALKRLANGKIIHCDQLPVKLTCSKALVKRSVVNIDRIMYAKSITAQHTINRMSDIENLLADKLANYKTFSEEQYQQFLKLRAIKNQPKYTKKDRLNKEFIKKQSAIGELRAYYDRRDMRKNSSIKHLNATVLQNMSEYNNEINSLLNLINIHRIPERKLNINDLEAIINRQVQ